MNKEKNEKEKGLKLAYSLKVHRSVWMALVLAFSFQLSAFSHAQSLSFGIYGRLEPDYLTPTLELSWPLDNTTLGLQAQRDAVGLSVQQALELGPAGRVVFLGRGTVGFAGWGLQTQANGTVGPAAFGLGLGYRSTAPTNLWVGDDALSSWPSPASGWFAQANGRYRLSSRETLGVGLGINDDLLGVIRGNLEATYAVRQTQTYTFGAGVMGNNWYGLLGWRGELGSNGTLLDTTLRAGLLNRLDSTLTLPLSDEDVNNLKLRLTVAYPWAAKLGLEVANIRLEATYDGGYALWLRYVLDFSGE